MAILRASSILIIMIAVCQQVSGQRSIVISGVVRNAQGENLSKASVLLRLHRDTLKTISREDGRFKFDLLGVENADPDRNFELIITMEGYKMVRIGFKIEKGQELVVLPPIIMPLMYDDLVPVMVMAAKPVNILKDTVEYNARAYSLHPGDELGRLMKQLPGIDWDMEGNLLAQGKKIDRVMINGLDFTGADLKTALQKIPADLIEKVEIIDDYGQKARLTGVNSGESSKVLNIVLKDDRRNGVAGNLELSLGDKDKYNDELFLQVFRGDRQLTSNDKMDNTSLSDNLNERIFQQAYAGKWNAKYTDNAEILIWGDNHSSTTGLMQKSNYDSSFEQLVQNSRLSGTNQNELVDYGQKYTPNSNTLLQTSVFVGRYHELELSNSTYSSNEIDSGYAKTANSSSLISNNSNTLATGGRLYFEKSNPANKQKFTVEADYHYKSVQNDQHDSTQTLVYSEGVPSKIFQQYLMQNNTLEQTLDAKINYYFPSGKIGLFELGYYENYKSTQNTVLTESPQASNGLWVSIDSLSNNFILSSTSNSAHMGYLAHLSKMNLTLSVNAQSWNLEGRTPGKSLNEGHGYFNVLPLLQMNYTISPGRKISLEYKGYPTAPTLQQMQPLLNVTNPQYTVQGNLDLGPSYTKSASLTFEQSSYKSKRYWGFRVGLSYQLIGNMIIPDVVQSYDSSSVIQQTYYVNSNGFSTLTGNYRMDLPPVLGRYLRISLLGSLVENRNTIMTNNVAYNSRGLVWGQGLKLGLRIPDLLELDLYGLYSRTRTQYSTGSSFYSYPALNWSFNGRLEAARNNIFEFGLTQSFTSGTGNTLQATPAMVNASFRRDFFPTRWARIKFSVFDLLNSSTGITQSVNATGITQNQTGMVGRYFLVSFLVSMEKFRSGIKGRKMEP